MIIVDVFINYIYFFAALNFTHYQSKIYIDLIFEECYELINFVVRFRPYEDYLNGKHFQLIFLLFMNEQNNVLLFLLL